MSASDETPVNWLVLFYLAGDLNSPRSLAIWEDLGEILSVGKDPHDNIHVVVQFDSLGNCFRYELESPACKLDTVMRSMKWPKVRDEDELDKEEYELEPPNPRHYRNEDTAMSSEDKEAQMKAWKDWDKRREQRRQKRDEMEDKRKTWERIQGSYLAEEVPAGEREDPRKRHFPVEVLGRINSGAAEELENFIVWGLTQSNAAKVALVVVGKDRLDPVLREGERRRLPQVFTLCRDDSTRDHLSFVEFSRAIRNALTKSQKRTKLDILAIDSAQSQFMELAHELENSVEVLIGAQTPIPQRGWNYRKVLSAWREALAGGKMPPPQVASAPCPRHAQPITSCQSGPADPHTVRVAERLIEAVHESYDPGEIKADGCRPEPYAISAIDLTQLPNMTANFDSACMTFMQSLGEGTMWEGRQILRDFLDEHLKNNQYDCGVFFEGLRRAMEIKCRCPVFDWLIWDLKQHGIGEHNGRFWNHVFDSIKFPPVECPIPQLEIGVKLAAEGMSFTPTALLVEAIGERWNQNNTRDRKLVVEEAEKKLENDTNRWELIRSYSRKIAEEPAEDAATLKDASAKVDEILEYFRNQTDERKTEADDPKRNNGARLVEQFRKFTKELLTQAITAPSDHMAGILTFLGAQDKWLEKIVSLGPGFPSEERWKSFEHMKITRHTVERLHLQAMGLTEYFPPRAVVRAKSANAAAEAKENAEQSATTGEGKAATETKTKAAPLVLATACTNPEEERWWTGLSLYRPHDLDTLMNREYRDFSFHRKVHWSALLGAIYLIEAKPPLAMWRLISSLITRGSGSTRRDLLEHLSGEKSVIWGMENQFRILAPAPVITLTLEHRETIHNRTSRLLRPPKGAGAGSVMSEENRAGDHIYLVRLESHRQGAIIFEHTSRVRSVTLEGVLTNLGEVLEATTEAERSFDRLTSLGGILGDEVLQELARALESEQRSIRNDVRRRNGMRQCIQCGGRDTGTDRASLQRAIDDGARDVDVHLQLHIPRELMHHPWELMSIHNRMLGFNFAIGRRVFMDSTSFRGDREREQGTIRPLLVVPRYEGINNLKELEMEKQEIQRCFEQLAASRGQLVIFDPKKDVLEGDQATCLNFRRQLRDGAYDIIHFAGHGQFVADDPESSAWVLTDGTLTAAEIRNALRNHPSPPWLVYANACKAGLSARSHSSPYVGEVHGLATAFISNGVAAYVGPLWDLGDGVARRIAVDFYKQLLLQGATLGEALLRAKRGVKDRFELERAQAAKAQQVSEKGNNRAQNEGDEETKAGDKISSHDISGAGVVLFGDASGELIQALAGVEKVSVQEFGSSTRDQGHDQMNHQTNQTK